MTKGQAGRSSACNKCGKTFARSDTLMRHEKSHLATEDRGPIHRVTNGTFRACSSCAQARARCSGGHPCGRCKVRSLDCTYPNKRRRTASVADGTGNSQVQPENGIGASKPTPSRSLSLSYQHYTPHPGESVFSYTAVPPNDSTSQADSSARSLMQMSNMTVTDKLSSPSISNPVHSFDTIGQSNLMSTGRDANMEMAIDNLPKSNEPAAGQVPYQGVMNYDFDQGYAAPAGEYPFGDTFDDPVNLNWIPISIMASPYGDIDQDFSFLLPSIPENVDFEHNFGTALTHTGDVAIPSHTGVEHFIPGPITDTAVHASVSALMRSPASSTSDGAAFRSISADGASSQYKSKKRKNAQIQGMFAPDRPVQKEYGFPDTSTPVLKAPPDVCSETAFSSMSAAFSRLCLGNCSQSQFSSSNFPDRPVINVCIDFYFDIFNPTFPLLHRPTIREQPDWIVCLAMAAIGSNFFPTSSCIELRAAFHEFLRRTVDDLTNSESQSFRNLSITQARVLNLVCMVQSDAPRSRLLVPRYHAELSRWCLESGILKVVGSDEVCSQNLPEQLRTTTWRQWIREESERRIGYLIWLLDCAVGYICNSRPLCNMDDARAPLPCLDSLWDAEDANRWFRLAANVRTAPSLCIAMENMYSMKKIDSNMGEISNILLVHALFSRTWEVGTHIRQPLSEWRATGDKRGFLKTPSKDDFWLPLYPLYANWRNSACDCLDVLHWHALSVVSRAAGSEHHTVLHLHLARIVLLTPFQEIQDLLFFLINQDVGEDCRATFYVHDGSYQRRTPTKLAQTRKITYRWLREDQHKARLAVVHAGSVFWHIRRYSNNSFFEPIAIYLASIVLWTYGSYKSAALEREAADRLIGTDANVQPTRVELAAQSHSPFARKSNNTDSPTTQSTPSHQPQSHHSLNSGPTPHLIPATLSDPSHATITPPFPTTTTTTPPSPSPSSPSTASTEESQPEFIHLDRPCDDEIVQHFVRNGHNMAGYMSHVGDICQTPTKVLLEGAKLLRSKLAGWGASRDYHDILVRLATDKGGPGVSGEKNREKRGNEVI